MQIIKITACAPPRCNCPEMEIVPEANSVFIKDDYNGCVQMTLDEFAILAIRFQAEMAKDEYCTFKRT